MKKVILILIASIGISFNLCAQFAGDYRSVGSGNWNDPTKWEVYNGTNWVATTSYPGENSGTGAVTIMGQTKIRITASVPNPVSSIYVIGEYACDCWTQAEYEAIVMLNGVLTFSAQNAVTLMVSGSVGVYGELKIDDQDGTNNHSLFIQGSLGVGDGWSDYEYYFTPTVFQTINQDDKLHVIFNTTVSGSSIYSSSMLISFQDVTFNGIGISLEAGVDIRHANFINGIVTGNSLNFGDDAIVSGASNASYVDGWVYKSGDDPFTFPIGSGGVYGPLAISAPAGQGASVSAKYIRANASNLGPISDPGLFNISNCEYWQMNTNENNLNVTVFWSSSSGCESSPYVSNVSDVTLAHFDYNTGKWDGHGGSGIGTTSNGSVTRNEVPIYGGFNVFTLGNLGACNAPWGTATNITSNSATLSWTSISRAATYDVDYKVYDSPAWVNAATATTSTTVALSGLSPLTSYTCRIRTNCGFSSSFYRGMQFFTLCGIPSALLATNITSSSATLNWSAVPNVTNYSVEYKQSTSATWIIAATGIFSSSYTLNGLSASTGYDWRVFANCYSGPNSYRQSSFTTASPFVCNDPYEPNSTSRQAKTIGLGTTIPAMISSSADIDWFKITAPNKSNYTLQFALANLPADYDLYVYDKNLTQISASTNNGTSNEVAIYNSNARKAIYYIKVIAKNGAYNTSQCYNLLAEVSNDPNSAYGKSYPANEVTNISEKQLLYPNPASEFVYLNFNSATEGMVKIQIVNSIGQLVKQHPVNTIKGQNQVMIQVNDIRPGIYIVRINKGDLNITRKFVIAR